MTATVTLLTTAYLLGSIPTGLAVAWLWRNIDIRTVGSGNIGATNVARCTTRRLGLITLGLDVSKGLVPVLLAHAVGAHPALTGLVAIAAVTGHCWSILLGFRGGKGVSTAAGGMLALAPVATLIAAAIWLTLLRTHQKASLAALVAAILLPLMTLLMSSPYVWAAIIITAIVVVRHRDNIERLRTGTERTAFAPQASAGED